MFSCTPALRTREDLDGGCAGTSLTRVSFIECESTHENLYSRKTFKRLRQTFEQ